MKRVLVSAAFIALVPAAVPVVGAPRPAAAADPVAVTQVWERTFSNVTFRESSPTPVNLTNPGVAVGGLDGKLYAFDLADGSDEAGWPVDTGTPISGSPAAVNLDGTGNDTVFIGSGTAPTSEAQSCAGGGTFAYNYRGGLLWRNMGSDGSCPNRPYQSSFTLGDITGAGKADASIGELGLYSPAFVASTGAMLSGWPYHADDTVFSTPALADVNGDGVPDVVMGGDSSPGGIYNGRGGVLRAINGIGQTIWNFVIDEQVRSSPAIGNLDGSGPLVVVGTGIKWVYSGGSRDATSLFAVDFAGHLRWREDLGGITIGSPALADVAGTGQLDVIEGTDGTPNSSQATIWVLDGAGRALPNWAGRPSDGGAIIGGITTADLNGDGAQDLIVPTGAGIWAYDGRTAQTLFTIDTGQVSYQSSPLVTDDGGGKVGITIAGTKPDGTGVVAHYRVGGNATIGPRAWTMFHHDARHTGNVDPPPLTVPGGRITPVAGATTSAPPPAPAPAPAPVPRPGPGRSPTGGSASGGGAAAAGGNGPPTTPAVAAIGVLHPAAGAAAATTLPAVSAPVLPPSPGVAVDRPGGHSKTSTSPLVFVGAGILLLAVLGGVVRAGIVRTARKTLS